VLERFLLGLSYIEGTALSGDFETRRLRSIPII